MTNDNLLDYYVTVTGKEAEATADNLINVLQRALVAAAQARWGAAHMFSEEAVVLAKRLDGEHK